jgi:hypothetical protein
LVIVLGSESVFWRGHDWKAEDMGRVILFLVFCLFYFVPERSWKGGCVLEVKVVVS